MEWGGHRLARASLVLARSGVCAASTRLELHRVQAQPGLLLRHVAGGRRHARRARRAGSTRRPPQGAAALGRLRTLRRCRWAGAARRRHRGWRVVRGPGRRAVRSGRRQRPWHRRLRRRRGRRQGGGWHGGGHPPHGGGHARRAARRRAERGRAPGGGGGGDVLLRGLAGVGVLLRRLRRGAGAAPVAGQRGGGGQAVHRRLRAEHAQRQGGGVGRGGWGSARGQG